VPPTRRQEEAAIVTTNPCLFCASWVGADRGPHSAGHGSARHPGAFLRRDAHHRRWIGHSRSSTAIGGPAFEALDKPALRPLPAARYELPSARMRASTSTITSITTTATTACTTNVCMPRSRCGPRQGWWRFLNERKASRADAGGVTRRCQQARQPCADVSHNWRCDGGFGWWRRAGGHWRPAAASWPAGALRRTPAALRRGRRASPLRSRRAPPRGQPAQAPAAFRPRR